MTYTAIYIYSGNKGVLLNARMRQMQYRFVRNDEGELEMIEVEREWELVEVA